MGELAVGLGFGPVVVTGTYWVQAQAWSWGALAASLPVGLFIAAVLYINEIPDRYWDSRVGKRTVIVRLPTSLAVIGYAVLVAAAYLSILLGVVTGLLPLPALLGLMTLPMAWSAFKKLRRHHAFPYRLIPANATTIFTHLVSGLLLSVGYLVAMLVR
jgi:1,4-dihydroxy-2-naphthoate octaprenyltransferase